MTVSKPSLLSDLCCFNHSIACQILHLYWKNHCIDFLSKFQAAAPFRNLLLKTSCPWHSHVVIWSLLWWFYWYIKTTTSQAKEDLIKQSKMPKQITIRKSLASFFRHGSISYAFYELFRSQRSFGYWLLVLFSSGPCNEISSAHSVPHYSSRTHVPSFWFDLSSEASETCCWWIQLSPTPSILDSPSTLASPSLPILSTQHLCHVRSSYFLSAHS